MQIGRVFLGGGDFLIFRKDKGAIEIIEREGTYTGSFLESKYLFKALISDLEEKGYSPTPEEYKAMFELLESL